jgi:exosortase E/protease (VPEID-CTERM system)
VFSLRREAPTGVAVPHESFPVAGTGAGARIRNPSLFLLLLFVSAFFLLSCEVIWTQQFLALRSLGGRSGWSLVLLSQTPLIVRSLLSLMLLSFGLLFFRLRASPASAVSLAVRWQALLRHAALFGCFAAATVLLRRTIIEGSNALAFVTVLWLAFALASLAALLLAFFPLSVLQLAGGGEWAAAAAASLTATALGSLAQDGWSGSAALTGDCVKWLLVRMGHTLTAKPGRIGTQLFAVRVDPSCSGYEGMALIFVFSVGWLIWHRREYRFPAAVILIPLGLALSWNLNVVRLVILILIGDAGHRDIAMGGFHTQAGWIAFSLLAIGFCAVSHRVPGVSVSAAVSSQAEQVAGSNPAAPWLAPFVAFQAAVMLTAAAGDRLEWSYPVRILAAITILYWYRHEYRQIRISAVAPPLLFALAAFLVWSVCSLRLPHSDGPVAALRALPLATSSIWLAFRIGGAVLVAPLVEELALRGFLMRAIQASRDRVDFAAVNPRLAGWLAIGGSSLCFGLLHGARWEEGAATGLCFACAYRRRGELGDAILAHAATNALLVVTILATRDWRYW